MWDNMKHYKLSFSENILLRNISYCCFLLLNEIKLLSKSNFVRVSVVLTASAMVLGLNFLDYSDSISLHNLGKTSLSLILGPSKYGAIAGSLLFALTTLDMFGKEKKQRSVSLLEATPGYTFMSFTRTASLLFYGFIAILLGFVFVFGIQALLLEVPLNFGFTVVTYVLISFATIIFTVLICAGLYMLTESIDISFLTYLGLFFMSLTSPNYLLNWVQTHAIVYSDFGGISPVIRLVLYSRCLWIGISLFIFISGMICKRRNGIQLLNLLKKNVKKPEIMVLLILILVSVICIYIQEPYICGYSGFADDTQSNENVKLLSVSPSVVVSPASEMLSANVTYKFETVQKTDRKYLEFLYNPGLDIKSLKVDGFPANWDYIIGANRIRVYWDDAYEHSPKNRTFNIEINYSGKLKNPSGNAFAGYITENSVYLLENSYWIFEPLTEKKGVISIQGSVRAPAKFVVVTPGKLTGMREESQEKIWSFDLLSPTSDLAVFAAEYEVKNITAGSTDIECYFVPEHLEYVEKTGIEYRIKEMVIFYENNIGTYAFDYPMKIVETPIYKSGGHSTQNIVTVAEYVFNREIDVPVNNCTAMRGDRIESFIYSHDMYLLAHEIAHQWWGSGVVVEEKSPWSSEAFAEYFSYKYIDSSFGYWASDYILNEWKRSYEQQKQSYYAQDRESLEKLPDGIKNKMIAEMDKVELYSEMPLKFAKAEEMLGEDSFLETIKTLYATHKQKTLGYDEFLKACNLTEEKLESGTNEQR